MKSLLLLILPLTFFFNQAIAQSIDSTYHKDIYLTKSAKPKKAKYLLVNGHSPNGDYCYKVINLEDNTVPVHRTYTAAGKTAGRWVEYDANGNAVVDENYNDIIYCSPYLAGKMKDSVEKFDPKEMVMAQFPGGDSEFFLWLGENLIYPNSAKEMKLSGKVLVSFVINKDGTVAYACILKGLHPILDSESLRIVHSMPKWTPATKNGEPVKVQYILPVKFTLR